jgi:hypothetical protein
MLYFLEGNMPRPQQVLIINMPRPQQVLIINMPKPQQVLIIKKLTDITVVQPVTEKFPLNQTKRFCLTLTKVHSVVFD